MTDIHREADEIVHEQEGEDAEAVVAIGCITQLEWVIESCQHLMGYHDLTDHEMVKLTVIAHEAVLEKIDLLGLDR